MIQDLINVGASHAVIIDSIKKCVGYAPVKTAGMKYVKGVVVKELDRLKAEAAVRAAPQPELHPAAKAALADRRAEYRAQMEKNGVYDPNLHLLPA